MNNHQRRLKAIEVSLTPFELVLLWMKSVLPGCSGEAAFQSPPPRLWIANSTARIVGTAFKVEPDAVVESGILQARREADWLYNIVIEVNSQVQSQYFERNREYIFLLAYFEATMRCPLPSVSDETLRTTTLLFVEQVLLLDGTVRRISADHFAGHPILFSDSTARLQEQMELVDQALDTFNFLAGELQFQPLNKEEVCESLSSGIDQNISRILLIARGAMLAVFGKDGDLQANFNRYLATYESNPAEKQR